VTDTISSAAHNPNLDVTQIRSSLVQNIQKNLQGVNLKQAEKLAEEYLKKSEGLLAEAGEFLKDAVKVVPPEEGDGSGIGMAWDGSDMYSFSTSTANNLPADEVIFDQSSSFLGGTRGASSEVIRAQRKDALMRRLRSDKELLLVDPAAEAESLARRESFKAFVEHEIEGRGGVEGDEITKMIWQELGPEAKDAEVLKATRDALGEWNGHTSAETLPPHAHLGLLVGQSRHNLPTSSSGLATFSTSTRLSSRRRNARSCWQVSWV
jgi:hypothetical protein